MNPKLKFLTVLIITPCLPAGRLARLVPTLRDQFINTLVLSIVVLVSLSNQAFSQWQQTSLSGASIKCFSQSGNFIFCGLDFNGGVYRSSDGGSTWQVCNNGLTNKNVNSLTVNNSYIISGTSGGVFVTNNSGDSWTSANTGLTNTYVTSIAVFGNNVIAGTYGGGVFISQNNGNLWEPANTGLTNQIVNCIKVNGNNIFVGTNGGLFLSIDNGNTWTIVQNGLPNIDVQTIAFCGNNIYIGTGYSGIYFAPSITDSWIIKNTGISTSGYLVHSIISDGSSIITGCENEGVFIWNESLNSWEQVNDGLTDVNIYALHFFEQNILAGTGSSGVFIRPLNQLVNINNSPFMKESTIIYPNPTKGNINLNSPLDNLKIEIYNIIGELLFSGEVNTKIKKIDLSKFSSGIYYLNLISENRIINREKLIIE